MRWREERRRDEVEKSIEVEWRVERRKKGLSDKVETSTRNGVKGGDDESDD